jgi:hypothetical protein
MLEVVLSSQMEGVRRMQSETNVLLKAKKKFLQKPDNNTNLTKTLPKTRKVLSHTQDQNLK